MSFHCFENPIVRHAIQSWSKDQNVSFSFHCFENPISVLHTSQSRSNDQNVSLSFHCFESPIVLQAMQFWPILKLHRKPRLIQTIISWCHSTFDAFLHTYIVTVFFTFHAYNNFSCIYKYISGVFDKICYGQRDLFLTASPEKVLIKYSLYRSGNS